MPIEIVELAPPFNLDPGEDLKQLLEQGLTAPVRESRNRYEVWNLHMMGESGHEINVVHIYDRLRLSNVHTIYDEAGNRIGHEMMPIGSIPLDTCREGCTPVLNAVNSYLDNANRHWRSRQDMATFRRDAYCNILTADCYAPDTTLVIDPLAWESKQTPVAIEWAGSQDSPHQARRFKAMHQAVRQIYNDSGDYARFVVFYGPTQGAYQLVYLFDRQNIDHIYCCTPQNQQGKKRYFALPVRHVRTERTAPAEIEALVRSSLLRRYRQSLSLTEVSANFDPLRAEIQLIPATGTKHVMFGCGTVRLNLPEL